MRNLLLILLIGTCSILNAQIADLIIHHANIYNHETTVEKFDAIAIKDGLIIALGLTDQLLKENRGKETKLLDAKGRFLMPAFIEGHGHFHSTGQANLNLNLMGTKNWQEIIEMVAKRVKSATPGEWISGRGWHQEKWDKIPSKNMHGFPYHDQLSEIAPDNPVVLRHASGHLLIANKKAMELAGVNRSTPSTPGGEVFKDAQGNPTGIFNETAMGWIGAAKAEYDANLSESDQRQYWLKCIEKAEEICLQKGVASFQDAGSTFDDITRYRELAQKGQLDVRLWIMLNDNISTIEDKMGSYVSQGKNPFFTFGGIKAYIDGALGSRGAWLLEPYSDMPETHGHRIISEEDFNTLAGICIENKLQLCTHAIGDKGNRVVLDTYKKYLDDKDRRWRVEHAQHLSLPDIVRFTDLGVIAAMQPIHCTSDAPFVEKRLGKKRAQEGAYVWRKLLEAGSKLNLGTDTPVESIDPFANIYAACTRKNALSGDEFYPAQTLSRQEALFLYTVGNAYSVFEEEQKGSLDVGKLADIIILDKNLLTCTDEEILSTKVLYTIIDGKVKYADERVDYSWDE